ncbi:MAG: alpha/beta fold hydrolase [Boseongicola sp.]|nr:MAG: alpha/beta fold hydrolase [Boseongicola sp.]
MPPFHAALAEGPEQVQLRWVATEDGVRLRLGLWTAADARATVLLFPGRTEYLEKYGRVAMDLIKAGFNVAAIDWRGQGYSDRLIADTRLGHVQNFADYQKDVRAFVAAVDAFKLSGPRVLLAHSMGGCIGLRALIDGLAVERAVFSAPMWGIHVMPALRPAAKVLPTLARLAGSHLKVMPGTSPESYVLETNLADSLLTSDVDHYGYLRRQAEASTELALAGPTIHWFEVAHEEMSALYDAARPEIPVLTLVGTNEEVVELDAIKSAHDLWPSATLEIVPGAKHEMMMEVPGIRSHFMKRAIDFLSAS